jgi:hypothetical protein
MAFFIQFLLDEKFDKLYAHRLGFIHTGGKMTPEDLRVLIEAGENLEVEFKGEEHGFMGTLFTSLIKSPIF